MGRPGRPVTSLRRARLDDVVINLMVMDCGKPDPRRCVPHRGRCDMARSARRAFRRVVMRC